MPSSDLVRWGGLAAMLSGVAFVLIFLVGLVIPGPPPGSFSDVLISILFVVALLLLLAGLAGFHALQKGSYGPIGRAGFYLVVASGLVQILAQLALTLGNTALELLDFLGLSGVLVGFVLYGADTLQARVLPRWCGVAFIVGLPVWVIVAVLWGEFGRIFGGILFGLLWLALGYTLWSRRVTSTGRAARVS